MKAVMRIAPLLLGLGVGEAVAEEAAGQEDRTSPIFVVHAPAEAAPPAATPPPQTPVTRQLAELIRRDVGERVATAAPAEEPAGDVLHLEKMTVEVKKIIELPGRETPLEKFTRTGHLWEFSPTKRFMVGPHGDKVGIMFSFDW